MDAQKINSINLFLISFIALFFELAVIRWVPGTVSAVSYFTNFVLISSFFGLGLGCALAKKDKFTKWLPLAIFILFAFSVLLQKTGVSIGSNLADLIFVKEGAQSLLSMYLVVPAIFLMNFLAFVPIGQILGRSFEKFKPLQAYSINIAGSIAGTVFFAFLSFLSTPPVVWFSLIFLLYLWFLKNDNKLFFFSTAMFAVCLGLVFFSGQTDIWSPYSKITLLPGDELNFFYINVNNDYQQSATNFSSESRAARVWQEIYGLPYKYARPANVLIVGSGAGNDVVLALETKVQEIIAVEIDPEVVRITKERRPDNPYSDPTVHVYVDDARSFMNHSPKKYDAVIYGFLDSHRLFASMANVRLDNFVYTLEGINQTKELLNDEGLVSLSFYVAKDWVGSKIYHMLKESFNQRPLVYRSNYIPTEEIFLVRKGAPLENQAFDNFEEVSEEYENKVYEIPHDEWPYMYLMGRFIPFEYLLIILLASLIVLATVYFSLKPFSGLASNMPFFFLGAGFMVMETKSIVELSLLFGSSWLVNTAVITAILLLILVANLLVIKYDFKRLNWLYLLLFVFLILSFIIPARQLIFDNVVLEFLIPALIVTSPLFFAAIIFSTVFKRVEKVSVALGLNLIGVVLGGFMEYFSLLSGLGSLLVIAFLLYALSFAALFQNKKLL